MALVGASGNWAVTCWYWPDSHESAVRRKGSVYAHGAVDVTPLHITAPINVAPDAHIPIAGREALIGACEIGRAR